MTRPVGSKNKPKVKDAPWASMGGAGRKPVVVHAPNLYPKQAAMVDDTARYTLCEASTKSGKTVACLWWLFALAIQGQRGWHYCWMAPYNAQAAMAFNKLQDMIPPDLYTASISLHTVTLRNGAKIWFKSGENVQTLYGYEYMAAVVDEASRLREEAWWALRSTLTATQGPVKIIGNVQGRKNWFFQMARKAEVLPPSDGQVRREYSYHKIISADAVAAGVLAAEEIEDARRNLPDHVFRQLYLAEATDDQTNPLGDVQSCVDTHLKLGESPPVVWGWDVAEYQDFTVGIALDAEGRVCRLVRWHKQGYDFTLDRIQQDTGSTPAIVDATHGSVGDPILNWLQKAGDQYEGFEFTRKNKQMLMEGLALAIQRREIRYPDHEILMSELESFEFVQNRTGVTYSAPEGMFDDCVCALALAVYRYRSLTVNQRGPVAIFAGQDEPQDLSDTFGSGQFFVNDLFTVN